jgi:hypothetical protein
MGRLAPNLRLETPRGESSLAALLRSGRGVLLHLADRSDLPATAIDWADRLDLVEANCSEDLGVDAWLIRPDGYTAWIAPAGSRDVRGLREALLTWFGDEWG